jgi:dihydrofolate reductase
MSTLTSHRDRPFPPTIPTPPPTNLEDNESPTTSDPDMPLSPTKVRRPLYLIVATALNPHMGIGFQGSLPWTKGLKSDMVWFRRVTMRAEGKDGKGEKSGKNAVIMGRKTWESIPGKFRPLGGRVNVVVTRDAAKLGREVGTEKGKEEVLIVSSLAEALKRLRELRGGDRNPEEESKDFVIGGSEIYRAALDLASQRQEGEGSEGVILRILQTQVRKKNGEPFECDTFFPVDLQGDSTATTQGFWKADQAATEQWVGEKLPLQYTEWADDAGGECEIRVVGWEKTW